MAKDQKAIIQLLATEYDLPLQEVEKIVYSQFQLVANTMSSGSLDTIRLPLLGRFHVRPGRVKKVTEKKKKKDERQST